MADIFRLHNQVKHYEWGCTDHIPRLLGIPGDGRPWAELWMGSHPGSPSLVSLDTGDISLGDLIARDNRRWLGEAAAERFGTLPFLFKLLAAESPLSIQAHPNLAQAREGFDRENRAGIPIDAPSRNYKDPNHKPEIICALTPFTGMCGLRSPGEIQELLAAFLTSAPAVLHEYLAPLSRALQASDTTTALQDFLTTLLNLPPVGRQALTGYITSMNAPSNSDTGYEWELIRRFACQYPGDPAVIAPLYLNVFRLEPGEAIFLDAGVPHAYIRGFGVELMANSDNVLRGGLTAKHIDIPELMKVLDMRPQQPQILKPQPQQCYTYPSPCSEFSLTVIQGSGPMIPFTPDSPSICIVTEGKAVIPGSKDLVLAAGESVFIPPAAAHQEAAALQGQFTMYAASCN